MSIEYSINNFGLLKLFKPVLSRWLIRNWYFSSYGSSISGCGFIRLSIEFVFADSEPPFINILHGRWGICG